MTSLQCDFVFQHRHGKKWICYTDAEIEVLNKALRRKQKTVTLPSKDPKKRIVVNFESMWQKNIVSNVQQRVRSLIMTDHMNAWMWKDDDDEYSSFRPFQVIFLEIAFQQNLSKIKFYNFGDYTVDLERMREINEETSKSTPVLRESVDLIHTTKIEEIINQSKVLLDRIRNSSLKSFCGERRIFDTSLLSLEISANSSQTTLPPNSFLNSSEFKNLESSPVLHASVDKDCPSAEKYEVHSVGNLYYSATLTLTMLENNINKYLIMQILESKENKYFLWERWGRIGNKSQTELKAFGVKRNEAVAEFEDRFYDKTKNEWQDVKNFRQVPGKYDLLHMDLSPEIVEPSTDVGSNLSKPVQELLSLITSRKMMNQMMEEMLYDMKRVPLGKLTLMQIKEGYSALNKIAGVISSGSKGKDLISVCDEFYTKIPHNFGRQKPPIIHTSEEVEEKLKMLEALLNINIAENIFKEVPSTLKNPLDQYYRSLECDIKPIKRSNLEFKVIEEYLLETHGLTHTNFKMEINEIFSCKKKSEETSYVNYENRFLLWHGSRLTNWVGILKEGLQIAPAEAPTTGSMFGKGLYFADVSSKSANYCFATKKQSVGLLILCEVCLGKNLDIFSACQCMPDFLPSGYGSVVGVGKYAPSSYRFESFLDGVKIPTGPLVENSVSSSLDYNEYVVYNTKQVKMKYLVSVKFHFN